MELPSIPVQCYGSFGSPAFVSCAFEPIHEIPATTKNMEEASGSGPRFKGLFVFLFPHSLGYGLHAGQGKIPISFSCT